MLSRRHGHARAQRFERRGDPRNASDACVHRGEARLPDQAEGQPRTSDLRRTGPRRPVRIRLVPTFPGRCPSIQESMTMSRAPWSNLAINESRERHLAWDRLLLEIARSISLPESLYRRLERHYDAIAEILTDPTDPELSDLLVCPQGSVRTRTLVRPLPGRD